MVRRQPLGTSEEVAAYLQVSGRTLDDWAYKNTGPAFTYAGAQRRYKWEDVERYLAERSREAGAVDATR